MNNEHTPVGDESGNDSIGRHMIWDLFGVERERIDDSDRVARAIDHVLKACRLTRAREPVVHQFSGKGNGVTGFVILKESHFSIHTFPESGYVAVELFYCGTESMDELFDELRERFEPEEVRGVTLPRGE